MTKEKSEKEREIGEIANNIVHYFTVAVRETHKFPYYPTSIDASMALQYARNIYNGTEVPNPEELIIFYLQGNLYSISIARALSKYSINQFFLKNNGWRDQN